MFEEPDLVLEVSQFSPVGPDSAGPSDWSRLNTSIICSRSFLLVSWCNSDFVLDVGPEQQRQPGRRRTGWAAGGGSQQGGSERGYCSPCAHTMCRRRMARACRRRLAYHSAVQGIEDLLIQHRCPGGAR
ncbi:hemojuvelin [Lates japonicus]|uniref:Hemojuvelin n=1 Tax=Lates japonicus TaxID=270547 RepID=A0AAD3NBD0_LATJO|nr:hemojuvelin [Lates japonicus]